MKKIILFLSLVLGITFSHAAHVEKATEASKQTEQRMAAEKFSHMTAKEYGEMRGKKLNFFEKIVFKSAQHKMQKQLKKSSDGIFSDFNIGGFVLGLLLGLIGVLLAYIFSSDSNLRKWSWIGFGTLVIILLLGIIL